MKQPHRLMVGECCKRQREMTQLTHLGKKFSPYYTPVQLGRASPTLSSSGLRFFLQPSSFPSRSSLLSVS